MGIANEVGTAKIANPFSNADIAYVESPYSYNSITDFRDNIRSIRNIWLGSTDKTLPHLLRQCQQEQREHSIRRYLCIGYREHQQYARSFRQVLQRGMG